VGDQARGGTAEDRDAQGVERGGIGKGTPPSQLTMRSGERRELPSGVQGVLELPEHVLTNIGNFGQLYMNTGLCATN